MGMQASSLRHSSQSLLAVPACLVLAGLPLDALYLSSNASSARHVLDVEARCASSAMLKYTYISSRQNMRTRLLPQTTRLSKA